MNLLYKHALSFCLCFGLFCGGGVVLQPVQAAEIIRIAVAYPPKTLNPMLAADAASARLLQLINPALLQLNEQYQPVPHVGSCTQPTPFTATCTLPAGRVYHNGVPLTANSVAEWYAAVQANPRSPAAGALKGIAITTPEPLKLVFTATSPTLGLLGTLAEIPLALAVSSTGAWPGLGGYTVENIDAVGNTTLKPVSAASPTLELTVLADPTTRLLKLKKGEVDVVLNDLPPELYAWGLKQGWPGLAVPGSSYTYMGLNFENPYLVNPSVRQAIALAVNAAAIRRTVLGGLAAPASSLLPPGHPLAWEAPEMPHDAFTAEELLDSAGYLRGPDNTRFTLVLSTSTDALASRVAQALQSQLKAIGINLVLRPTEWSAFFTSVQKGQYDAVLLTWTGAQTPISYYNFFNASQVPPNGLNRGRVNDAALNQWGEAIRNAATPEQLAQATLKAQQRQKELLPYIPLYRRHHTLLARPNMHGCQLPATGAYTGLANCVKN